MKWRMTFSILGLLALLSVFSMHARAKQASLSDDEAQRIVGRDTFYCWPDCDTYGSSCDDDGDCFGLGNVGNACGNRADPDYAETCQADFGNNYCDPASTQQVCVLCATVYPCTCKFTPPAGGVPGRYTCEAAAAPTGYTHVNIDTDTLACSYTEGPAGACP